MPTVAETGELTVSVTDAAPMMFRGTVAVVVFAGEAESVALMDRL